jgi:hypothetical protein
MLEFENEIYIKAPVYEVFAFIADLENLPKWNFFVVAVLQTSYGPVKAGSTFHQTRESDAQDLVISTFKRDKMLVIETLPPFKPRFKRSMSFQEEGIGTRIIDHWQLDASAPGFLGKFVGMGKKTVARENLGKLKLLLETGEVTLQDGRRMTL